MNGYCGKASYETNNIKKTHKDGLIWVHTGDIGYMSEDGCVYIKGRITRTILLFSTEKVYPSSLEDKLSTVKGVKEIAAIAIPDPQHEGFVVPACCVVGDEGLPKEEITQNILKFCSEYIETYAFPREIFFVPQLPITKMGKVDYRTLEKQAENQNKKCLLPNRDNNIRVYDWNDVYEKKLE